MAYHANRESNILRQRKYRQDNPDSSRKSSKIWYQNNKDIRRALDEKRRARKLNQLGWLPDNYEYLLWVIQEGLCAYCVEVLDMYHLDHKMPLSKGGFHDWDNVCLACPSCNLRKNAKTVEEFLSLGVN